MISNFCLKNYSEQLNLDVSFAGKILKLFTSYFRYFYSATRGSGRGGLLVVGGGGGEAWPAGFISDNS